MNYKILSGNTLKIIAAISMLIDHIGLFLFPRYMIFRIFGRLAFPIFAFMISEGARYTRNRFRHFAVMLCAAVICDAGRILVSKSGIGAGLCILTTFSISTLLIYALEEFKKALFSRKAGVPEKALWGAVFIGAVFLTYLLNRIVSIDYGFLGCITPLFASIFDFRKIDVPKAYRVLDNTPYRILCMLPPLVGIIATSLVWVQIYSILSIPLLLLYSEKRGTLKLKYFFYMFYPAHLVLIYMIRFIITR